MRQIGVAINHDKDLNIITLMHYVLIQKVFHIVKGIVRHYGKCCFYTWQLNMRAKPGATRIHIKTAK